MVADNSGVGPRRFNFGGRRGHFDHGRLPAVPADAVREGDDLPGDLADLLSSAAGSVAQSRTVDGPRGLWVSGCGVRAFFGVPS